MRRLGVTTLRARLAAWVLAAGITALAGVATGQAPPTRPDYLPYVQFAAGDTAERVALKKAYNEAILSYNQGLYEYHVTLENHNQLVERHNKSTDPAEQKRARDEAQALRAKLTDLRSQVTRLAAAVDEAARKAAAGGVSVK